MIKEKIEELLLNINKKSHLKMIKVLLKYKKLDKDVKKDIKFFIKLIKDTVNENQKEVERKDNRFRVIVW
jgi:hypothetical protein